MKKVYFITDYKGYFGSKYNSSPYRGGMDRDLLSVFMAQHGYESFFIRPLKEDLSSYDLSSGIVVFGSHQDEGLFYKGYMEDLAVSLEASGYRVCPSPLLIRAHENKVFFEMLRHFAGNQPVRLMKSWWYGSYEEFSTAADGLPYPVLIKRPHGSMSRGVFLARNRNMAERIARKIMSTPGHFLRIRDYLRCLRHKNYLRESWKRGKIAVQEFIPGLKNDYKILVFGLKYYVLFRKVREGDFRASGQGMLEYRTDLPDGLLEFAVQCFGNFIAPHASFDIGYDGSQFYLFEAQYACFGTYTIENAPFYFIREQDGWTCVEQKSCLEEEYARSLAWYLTK